MSKITTTPSNMEIKVYHWTEIRIINRKIDRRMLLKDGFIDEVKCSLINESPRMIPSQKRLVLFDREFISHQLAKVLEPISQAPEELLKQLIDEALFQIGNSIEAVTEDNKK